MCIYTICLKRLLLFALLDADLMPLMTIKCNQSNLDNVKVCFGNMFIKFPQESTRSMILKDHEQLDKEITDLRKRLKTKINRLNDLQGKPELRGYNLSPLSSDEIKAINNLLKK
ncbi:p53 and DNA damage-regulated protein 1-like [Sinocyclocheilus anshuiensis]|uniref:p53 and DNA damage-regulated protein 1 n=1 Tax=Sinocyclocheilus anshuiensis TaxID=1608454 RepID=A0A671K214_9TELE|nr:PREDICTED: p53 and DNA damage-regulated protein 1-like [Sinocyclocheilus anshuiensis]